MKKLFYTLIIALCLAIALSVASYATELENEYYVVQSESSELASSLRDQGKNVVGISTLYATKEDASKSLADYDYFINRFEGGTLNLVLAENVSYALNSGSGPDASGVRLQKPITLNVHFNGHSWWIPNDSAYRGFFIANENATLCFIGNRTVEEIKNLSVPDVYGANQSNIVDYYGGYVGIYITCGKFSAKNAIITAHDEVLYQKAQSATGKTVLELDNCAVYLRNRTCFDIRLASQKGNVEIELRLNNLKTHSMKIDNVAPNSYIKNSKIETTFDVDSWLGDDRINKDNFYIENSSFGSYNALGDTQVTIAKDSDLGALNLIGDTTGGAMAILTNCTYKSYRVQPKDAKYRSGQLEIITVPSCEAPGTRTVITYDNGNVTTVDEQYSLDNPALGHVLNYDNVTGIVYENGFINKGSCVGTCLVCETGDVKESEASVAALIVFLGISTEQDGYGICAGYSVNSEAIKLYESYGNVFEYGVVAYVPEENETSIEPVNNDLTCLEYTISASLTNVDCSNFEFVVRGFGKDHYELALVMCAYVYDGSEVDYVNVSINGSSVSLSQDDYATTVTMKQICEFEK